MSIIEPFCVGCNKFAFELEEYQEAGKREDMAPDDFVKSQEGTYNMENGHFLCTPCYTKAGMPSSPQGWIAP